jgi:hypothetical protein
VCAIICWVHSPQIWSDEPNFAKYYDKCTLVRVIVTICHSIASHTHACCVNLNI